MFGVKFSSKVDTRNLILPYGYVEHPLKKNVTGNYTFSIRFSGCEHMLK